MEKYEIEHLYKELYEMDGRGLSDYLNDWTSPIEEWVDLGIEINCTLHGEKVFIQGDHYEYGTVDIFDRWDIWRREVAYYFDGFIRESENLFDNDDDMREYFTWKICNVLGIIESLEQHFTIEIPFKDIEIMFM
jgi:hypothetical protein